MHKRFGVWLSISVLLLITLLSPFAQGNVSAQSGDAQWVNIATISWGGIIFTAPEWNDGFRTYLEDRGTNGTACLELDTRIQDFGLRSTTPEQVGEFATAVNSFSAPVIATPGVHGGIDNSCDTDEGLFEDGNDPIDIGSPENANIWFYEKPRTDVPAGSTLTTLESVWSSAGGNEDEMIVANYNQNPDEGNYILDSSAHGCSSNDPAIEADGSGWRWEMVWSNCDQGVANITKSNFVVPFEPTDPGDVIDWDNMPLEADWKNTATILYDYDSDGTAEEFTKSTWNNDSSWILTDSDKGPETCTIGDGISGVSTDNVGSFYPDSLGNTLDGLANSPTALAVLCYPLGIVDINQRVVQAIALPANANARKFFVAETVALTVVRTIWTSSDNSDATRHIGDYIPNGSIYEKTTVCIDPSTLTSAGSNQYDWDMGLGDSCQSADALVQIDIDPDLFNNSLPGDDEGEENTGDAPVVEPNCRTNNPGLGWILCPVMVGLVQFLDQLTFDNDDNASAGFLGSILDFDIVGTQEDALQQVWGGFRTLANLLFVIVFLAVVYSAATGSVLSSYDVKRMLPRLAIAAIAVQLSFFIAAFLLGLFNDIGLGAGNLITAPLPGDSGAESAVAGILSRSPLGTEYTGFAVGILFLILGIVVALGAIAGILLMAVVFILRNLALIVMIVLAPLAFVLWVLPNTERIFKKWWEWYIQLLMIFPIAAVLFASGKLVSYIWTAGAGSGNTDLGEGDLGAILIGTLALFAPYYLAPKLFSLAGGAMAQIANGVNNAKEGIQGRESYQRVRAKAKAGELTRGSNAASRRLNSVARGVSNPLSTRANPFRGSRDRNAFRPRNVVRKMDEEDKKAAQDSLDSELAGIPAGEHQQHLRGQALDERNTEGRRQAAMERMLINNDIHGLEMVQARAQERAAAGDSSEMETFNRFLTENGGTVAGKARHLIHPAGVGGVASANGETLAGQHGQTLQTTFSTLLSEQRNEQTRIDNIRTEATTARANGDITRADQLDTNANNAQTQLDNGATARLRGMVDTYRNEIEGNALLSGRMAASEHQLFNDVDQLITPGPVTPEVQARLGALDQAPDPNDPNVREGDLHRRNQDLSSVSQESQLPFNQRGDDSRGTHRTSSML